MRIFLVFMITLAFAPLAGAYTGPGLGLGVIGTVVGVVFSLLLALLAVFWYPLKRALKIGQKKTSADEEIEEETKPEVEKAAGPQ